MTLIPVDPEQALEAAHDPEALVLALAERAKDMLVQAQGLSGLAQVVEAKAVAETIRTWTRQKDVSQEAADVATEMVRRCERRIGELIREGQAAGEIATRGDETSGHRRRLLEAQGAEFKKSPTDAAGVGHSSALTPLYELTDGITSEQFEEALTEAKEEGNLSRANVARKAQAKRGDDVMARLRDAAAKHPARPPAPPKYGGNRRKHLAQIEALIVAVSGAVVAFEEVDQLDPSVTAEEAARLRGDLSTQIRQLNRINALLKERTS